MYLSYRELVIVGIIYDYLLLSCFPYVPKWRFFISSVFRCLIYIYIRLVYSLHSISVYTEYIFKFYSCLLYLQFYYIQLNMSSKPHQRIQQVKNVVKFNIPARTGPLWPIGLNNCLTVQILKLTGGFLWMMSHIYYAIPNFPQSTPFSNYPR